MNTITHAFKAAGIKTPTQFQRVWTWLKDHQPQTAKAVDAALSLPQASSLLSQMEKRGMVSSSKEFDRRTGFNVKRFIAAGREYELLPLPKAAEPAPKPKAEVFNVQFAPMQPSKAPVQLEKFNLESMTIAEARQAYHQLRAMFGGV